MVDVFTRKSYRDAVICIVEKASHYRYSSASNYVNNEGLVAIELVDNPVVDVFKKSVDNKIQPVLKYEFRTEDE